jgi:hypothetical protein
MSDNPRKIVCTAERPWMIAANDHWVHHPDARPVGKWPAGGLVNMRCPHCGLEWAQDYPPRVPDISTQ